MSGVLSGLEIVEKGIVQPPQDLGWSKDQIQPHGVDLRVGKIYFPSSKPFGEKIEDSEYEEVPSVKGEYVLPQGAYVARILEVIDLTRVGSDPLDLGKSQVVGYGYSGAVKGRSSLLRRGVFIESSWWDFGYRGSGMVGILVANPNGIILHHGDRFCQIYIFKADPFTEKYRGQFQGEGLCQPR